MELSLLAADDLEKEQQRLNDNWKQRLERTRFEADRAHRQYQVVEPENRLVARELDRRWDASLQDVQRLEKEYAQFRQTHPPTLSDQQRELIRSLSENSPTLWRASTTTSCDRQRIVRLLIERVVVTIQGTTEQVDVSLHWTGGFISQHELLRPVRYYEQTRDYERLMTRINELVSLEKSYPEIAGHLSQEGFHPVKQATEFNKKIVERLVKKIRRDHPISKTTTQVPLEDNEWCVNDLAEKLAIPRTTLLSWIQRGWIHVSRRLSGYRGRIICWVNANEIDRLQRLRATKRYFGDPSLPKELTTPNIASSDS